jgi:ATP-binding cassette subfamily C protein LapB
MNLIDKYKLNDPVCKFRLDKSEVVLSSLAINILSLALPIMVLQVYDRIMINHSIGTLTVLAIGVSIAIILEGILRIARAYTTSWAGMMYEYTMAANAMRIHINANPIKLEKEGTGQQLQNLNTFSKLRDFYSGQTLINIVDIPFAFTFLVLISYLTGKLVIVPIVLIAIFTISTWFIGNKLKQALLDQGDVDDKRYNFIVEALQGIHTIKSLGLEAIFTRRYARLEEDSSVHNYKTALISTEGYAFGILFNLFRV